MNKKLTLGLSILTVGIVILFFFWQKNKTTSGSVEQFEEFSLIDSSSYFTLSRNNTNDESRFASLLPFTTSNTKQTVNRIVVEIVDAPQQFTESWSQQNGNLDQYFSFSYQIDNDVLNIKVNFNRTSLENARWKKEVMTNFLTYKIIQVIVSQKNGFSFDKSSDEAKRVNSEFVKTNTPYELTLDYE